MQVRLPTEERQADIVAAALRLARERSPPLITTAEIASAVGVSQGAVFKHFPTKDAIWLAAMVWVREQLLMALDAAAGAAASPLAALDAVFNAHVDFVVAHPGVPRIIFHELQKPPDSPVKQEVRSLLQSYRKLLLRLLDDGVRQGELRADLDPNAAATVFVGIVQGLIMQNMAAGKTSAVKAPADGAFAIYLCGVAKPNPHDRV